MRFFISNFSDLEEVKSRAYDNLGRVYARMEKYEDAIKMYVAFLFTLCMSEYDNIVVVRYSLSLEVNTKLLVKECCLVAFLFTFCMSEYDKNIVVRYSLSRDLNTKLLVKECYLVAYLFTIVNK